MATQAPGPLRQRFNTLFDIANGRHRLAPLVPASLLSLDAIICAVIIWRVPYTEIDWVAYMEQISQFLSGERDYTYIKGGTGPLVYPAAHVYIYSALYYLTERGTDIFMAQQLFAMLYIATLTVVMGCYWQAKVPPYVFPLLILSKRMHSIFVLRCFNDCFAVFFLFASILFLQRRAWTGGALAYAFGLGVKMSLLLGLPAVGCILFLGRGFSGSLRAASLMAQVQLVLAAPFLKANFWGYLSRAFELSRVFLWKWTVNWRFVGETMFLSRPFAVALLGMHAVVLFAFATRRWLRLANKPLGDLVAPMLALSSPFTAREEATVARAVDARYVMTTLLTATTVGLLFARSLHYQFYAYLAWTTPYLLWRSGVHPVVQYALWAAQEWAWNVYPSTPVSSAVVVGVLGATTALVWVGARDEYEPRVKDEKARR